LVRQGEALGLWWEDVDLDARLLRVRRALQCRRGGGGGLVLTEPKTQRSKRTVPLPDQLAAALDDHRQRQAKERAAAGSLWQDGGYVFTTPTGTPVDPRNDFRQFRKLLVRAGLPPVRLHHYADVGIITISGTRRRACCLPSTFRPAW
jgi:integrase